MPCLTPVVLRGRRGLRGRHVDGDRKLGQPVDQLLLVVQGHVDGPAVRLAGPDALTVDVEVLAGVAGRGPVGGQAARRDVEADVLVHLAAVVDQRRDRDHEAVGAVQAEGLDEHLRVVVVAVGGDGQLQALRDEPAEWLGRQGVAVEPLEELRQVCVDGGLTEVLVLLGTGDGGLRIRENRRLGGHSSGLGHGDGRRERGRVGAATGDEQQAEDRGDKGEPDTGRANDVDEQHTNTPCWMVERRERCGQKNGSERYTSI